MLKLHDKMLQDMQLRGKIQEVQKLSTIELLLKITGLDLRICPCCKQGKMVIKQLLGAQLHT